MIATVDKDSRFTKVCVTLPNFLMKANNNISKQYSPANYTDIGEPFRGKACWWEKSRKLLTPFLPFNNSEPNDYYDIHIGLIRLGVRTCQPIFWKRELKNNKIKNKRTMLQN